MPSPRRPAEHGSPDPDPGTETGSGLSPGAALALVFGSSAAVLVVEITALRLLAPYLGLSLETSTLVIGLALSAIALGSWQGGRIADEVDPRRLLAPALGISGAVVALTPSLLRTVAEHEPGALLLAAAVSILVPGALLAAVTPMVTKLCLTDLDETGSVVGQLSGVGTLGAIVGTVVTGFVLISHLPVTGILLGLGSALVLSAVVVGWFARSWRAVAASAVLVVLAGAAALLAPGGCDVETRYHCARVLADPIREDGRTLVLDGVSNSYVALDDPTFLEFTYTRAFAAVIETSFPAEEPLDAYHLGAGGLTIPRWLAEVRPGSRSLVSEIDPGVVRINQERWGLRTGPALSVRVEDGRLGLRRLETDSRDLVVGDAFSGSSVPWHLTTRQAAAQVNRVLRPQGVYVLNLIDFGDLRFVRAEIATLMEVFDHVALAGDPAELDLAAGLPDGGNLVALATDRTHDPVALERALEERETGWRLLTGSRLEAWTDEAQVLTDDHAPVDKLLAR